MKKCSNKEKRRDDADNPTNKNIYISISNKHRLDLGIHNTSVQIILFYQVVAPLSWLGTRLESCFSNSTKLENKKKH